VGQSFVDTIVGQTLALDLSKVMGGAKDITSLSTDLFLIVIRMREAEDLGDPAGLRKLILYYMDLFRKNCAVIGIPEPSIQEAVYAVVALIDEAVLSIRGACRDYWIVRPLQLDLFGDNIAGEEFYRKMNKLLEQVDKKKDILEVYYICLSLGFEGKYKLLNPEERIALLDETGKRLRRARIRSSSAISPHGKSSEPVRLKNRVEGRGFPFWAGAAIAGGICVIVYIVLSLIVSGDMNQVMQIVERMNFR
jgi:type VI secretion system protein ImpK